MKEVAIALWCQTSATHVGPTCSSTTPANRHALTAVEKQGSQLEKLLKYPSKAAYIPLPPKEKTIGAAWEMMMNVLEVGIQFHVSKASRRGYERLKLLEEATQKEWIFLKDSAHLPSLSSKTEEFERKRREAEEITNAKTAKNRAKRANEKWRKKWSGRSSRAEYTSTDIPL